MSTNIVGHRGAAGLAPENTSSSFNKAVEYGLDGVEFDVHMTKDNRIVVFHDEKVDRTTDGQGYIKDMTLGEIKKLDAGKFYNIEYRGEKVLTLEETLEIVKNFRIINIELKNSYIRYPGLEEKVLKIIYDNNIEEKVILSSFNHYSLGRVKELSPSIKTGALYMAGLYQPWVYAKKLGVDAIHPYYPAVTPEIIKKCHDQGIEVNVFGTNDENIIKNLMDNNIDMVITDYPERILKL